MTALDARFAGLTILVAEDEMLVAIALEDALLELGCTVVGPAPRLDAAVALIRTERLDGAVLNVNLGGALIVPVAAALAARAVPFLFCTGYTTAPAVLDRFRSAPILAKPFTTAMLAEALAQIFPGR